MEFEQQIPRIRSALPIVPSYMSPKNYATYNVRLDQIDRYRSIMDRFTIVIYVLNLPPPGGHLLFACVGFLRQSRFWNLLESLHQTRVTRRTLTRYDSMKISMLVKTTNLREKFGSKL